MAAYLQWRRFVFFDKEPVKEPLGNDGAAPATVPAAGSAASKFLCLPPGITVCDSGRGSLVFGDILSLSCLLPPPVPEETQLEWNLVRVVPASARFPSDGRLELLRGLMERKKDVRFPACHLMSPGQVL